MSDEEITAALAATLPKGEHNGLTPYARLFADFPKKIRAAVVLLDCSKTTESTDDGSQRATVRIRRVELIVDTGDAKVIERMVERAYETRTGKTMLPFDLEAEVQEALSASEEEVTLETLSNEGVELVSNVTNLPADGQTNTINATFSEYEEQDPTAGPWDNG